MESELIAFLCTLTRDEINEVYTCPASCVAVLRCVGSLAQQIICRISILPEKPLPVKLISNFLANPDEFSKLLEHLIKLQILSVETDFVTLNVVFKQSLAVGLCGKPLAKFSRGNIEEKYLKKAEELTQYSKERWECLLQFLADNSDSSLQNISKDMRRILTFAGFVTEATSSNQHAHITSGALQITSNGFHFLLQERRAQIWSFLIQYLKFVQQTSGVSLGECIKYLFRISFSTHSTAFTTGKEGDCLADFIQHLRELGLIYIRKRKDGWFMVTPMVHFLSLGGGGRESLGGNTDAFIVLETNYRIYAYTESSLQLSIIATFAEMMYRFSKMSVACLTRESVRKALQIGITSEQIISYLRAHSLTNINHAGPIVPIAIADQLRLWEMERDRFKFENAVLYSNFEGEADFQMVYNFAQQQNLMSWGQQETRLLIVSGQGHDAVKHFWKNNKR